MNPENGPADAVRIGEWLAEPSLNRLSRGDTVVHLRPKAMDVLALLARQPGLVVSRETIIDTVWAKEFIADSALASAISELRKALGDDPQNPTYIETIQKRGYRLMQPVVVGSTGAAIAPPPAAPTAPPRARSSRVALVAAAAAIVAAASVVGVLGRRQVPAEAVRLAVQPFENLGPAETAYFAAGITEEITAGLAAVPSLHVVVAGMATGRTAGSDATPSATAGGGASHVLSGSVRWAGSADPAGAVRITPRLVRTRDGATVWSRVYERSVKDVFAVQSEIAREVALHLDVVLTLDQASGLETAGTSDPEAHDAYLRGLYDASNLESAQDQLRAVRLFEQAAARDSAYAAPWVALARTNALVYHFGADRSPQRLAAARQARDHLAAIGPDRPEALVASAYVAFAEMRVADAAASIDAAGPGALHPFGRGFRADIARRLGRFEEALELYREWLDASPLRAAYVYEQMGATAGFLGRWDEADQAYQAAVALDPGRHNVYPARAHVVLLWKRSLADARAVLDLDPVESSGYQLCERWLLAICERDWSSAVALAAEMPPEGAWTAAQRVPTSLVLAETYRIAGDAEAARRAFEASRVTLEREVEENPEDFRRYGSLGLAYAGLGRRDDAVRSCQRARAMCPVTRDAVRGAFYLHDLALTHVMTGALDDAAATLEELLSGPHHPGLTPVLDLDPRWAPLRSHPAFPRLLALAGGEPRQTPAASAPLPAAAR
ncbi:MAG: winged helix-turn-helix domain-containing protein [Acidobacteria bacterium]|nr:winged helix-turn-helix domain-containing protein [Acidobacteriota bacterium]